MTTTKSLLAVDTYCGIYHFLPRMWPYYQMAGLDIIGIVRSNARKSWPMPCSTIVYGEDLFKRWCDHLHPTLLPERMLGMMQCLISDGRFSQYDNFVLSSWNCMFLKPLPDYPGKLTIHKNGGDMRQRGFLAPYFFHFPIWFDRSIGAKVIDIGRNLLSHGKNEKGGEDLFLGLIVYEGNIDYFDAPGFAKNNIAEAPHYMEEARAYYKAKSKWWIKGVKTPEQLANLIA